MFQSLKLSVSIIALWALASVAGAETFVWQAERDGNTVLLAGTVHLLKASDFPLPEAYNTALERADIAVFETDLDAAQAPAFGLQVANAMRLPEGQTLESVLSADTWQALQRFATERQLPLAAMQSFEPAFVAITFTVLEMQKLGFAEGVDVRFSQRAKDMGKPRQYLETLDEQLAFMKAMTEVEPNRMVDATLKDLRTFPDMIGQAVAAWRRGDTEALDALMGEPMREESEKLYRIMLTDRNRQWADTVDGYLNTPDTELVLVGAMHLAGPDNLRELLKKRGVSIQPYEP